MSFCVKKELAPPQKRWWLSKIVAMVLGVGCLLGSVTTASAVGIQVEMQNTDPVDIILCAGDTSMDLEDFASRLEAALVAAGVDRERLHIQVSANRSFTTEGDGLDYMVQNWYKVQPSAYDAHNSYYGLHLPDASVWTYYPSGRRLDALLSRDQMRRFYGLICNEPWTSGRSSALMVFRGYCDACPAGVSSRIRYDKNTGMISGFFVSMESAYRKDFPERGPGVNGSGNPQPVLYYIEPQLIGQVEYDCGGWGFDRAPRVRRLAEGRFWEVHFGDGKYPSAYDANAFPLSDPISVEMVSEGNLIQVYINDVLDITYTDTEGLCPTGTLCAGAAYSGHTGIKSAKFEIKGLTPLIVAARSPKWTTKNSNRFYVDVCDVPREDFADSDQVGELAQRLGADGAYYIGWGTNSSRSSINQFIQRLGGTGKYIASRSSDVYKQTAEYIEPIVNKRITGDGTVLLIKDKQYEFTTNGVT